MLDSKNHKKRPRHPSPVRDPKTVPFGTPIHIAELAAWAGYKPGYYRNLWNAGKAPAPRKRKPGEHGPNEWPMGQEILDYLVCRAEGKPWAIGKKRKGGPKAPVEE